MRIDAALFKDMMIAAANYLEHNKQTLNDLNVFPVPDGDTGTNMLLTMVSATREVTNLESEKVGPLAKAMGDGALRGARGNSGVILSQLFRGFAQGIDIETEELTPSDMANAIIKGVESAYKAVMKPREGTILTVAKSMAEEAEAQVKRNADMQMLIDAVIDAGQATLMKTPEMLPVLKEAGVVDAGGAGLLAIYNGFRMAINGDEIIDEMDLSAPIAVPASAMTNISTADIEFGYCTEFFITNTKDDVNQAFIDKFRDKLLAIGDSLVVVGDPELIKVHVHSNNPGRVLQYALQLGDLSNIKIDNMREQHNSLTGLSPVKPQKPMAVVAVCAGEGLGEIFKDYNVDELVSGGQSMNPSAEDIAKAVEAAPSNEVIILPNNKNIILAAEQVADLTEKHIYVIPTTSFPQGLAALLSYNMEASVESNVEEMKEAVSSVKSAQITKAVRDSKMTFDIKEGEFIGILEGDIVSHGDAIDEALKDLVAQMVDDDAAVITLYYGEEENEEAAEALIRELEAQYDDLDIEAYFGGQPVYHYILSVE
ncbi:MAG: DAK2 domain-containing protein [Christensenellaceae bacterium]